MESGVSSKPSRVWAWLWGVAIILIVAGAGVGTWYVVGRGSQSADAVPTTGPTGPRLTSGEDYYLHVKIIEVADRRPDGKTWDTGGTAPDVRFNLTWHDNIIWESAVKPDTLIGSWDLLKIDLTQLIASGGTADLENAINAPLVHYTPGETVKLTVWDDDTVDTDNVGTTTLRLDDLAPGDNTILPPAGEETGALKRVVLTLIDRKTPLPKLIETISNR